MSILKNEIDKEISEKITSESGIEDESLYLDIEDICKESALVTKSINDAINIMSVIESDETINFETAVIYALPLFGYDKKALMDQIEILNVETGSSEVEIAANVLHVLNVINDTIKKALRVFYVLFKKAQQKIILFLNNVKPFIEKLNKKFDLKDFSKYKGDLTDSEKHTIVSLIGVYGIFSGKIDAQTPASIITSFKNLKDLTVTLEAYRETMKIAVTRLKNPTEIDEKEGFMIMKNNFFAKLPKFYKKISDGLFTSNLLNTIKWSERDEFKKAEVSACLATDGNKILILTGIDALLVPSKAYVTDNMVKNVDSHFTLNDSNIKMLIKAIEAVDLKSISDDIRKKFTEIESDIDKFFKELSTGNFETADGKFTAQLMRAFLSANVSNLNSISFDYINMSAKLMVNTLKFTDLILDKYENK